MGQGKECKVSLSSLSKSKVDTSGLAILLVDYLAQREWVREEHLLKDMIIAPKLVLRALNYLKEERILRSDSRREGKRSLTTDVVVQVTKSTFIELFSKETQRNRRRQSR